MTNKTHTALRDFDREWKTGDRARARQIACDYVETHKSEVEAQISKAIQALREAKMTSPPTVEELVSLVDQYREAQDESSRLLVSAYLKARHGNQVIVGRGNIGGRS